MKYYKYILLLFILALPINSFSQPLVQSEVSALSKFSPDNEAFAYYDLRNRKTYIQLTTTDDEDLGDDPEVCVHIQIFQQDKGCVELDFEDVLTVNDTVIYDMDNIVRNDGSEVPINLDDDSYGYVAFSYYECDDRGEDGADPLLGNFRIIDDTGYEYRMNLFVEENEIEILNDDISRNIESNVIIPFNTADGARYADIVGFVVEVDRSLSGNLDEDDGVEDTVYNEAAGLTFSVFQYDENEEPLSCDQKTIGCGPNVVLNYGINEDYRASRGNNLLCEGAGLNPDQTNGYISLENAFLLSPIEDVDDGGEIDDFEFICMVGLNNNDGTGSMDACRYECIDEDGNCDQD